MSKAPAMPLFVDAYIADTTHLSEAEDGVYMRLLMGMWRREGRLADDDARLARIARVSRARWAKTYRPALEDFFDISDGVWSQKRLRKEWRAVAEKVAKNRRNGAQGGRPNSLKNNETVKANGFVSHTPNQACRETQAKSTHIHTHTVSSLRSQSAAQQKTREPRAGGASPLLAWIGRGGHNAAPRRRVER